jgi:hypothetical protein
MMTDEHNSVTDLVDYSRQEAMMQDMGALTINDNPQLIVGCGGVGWWLATFLAMLGATELVLVDGDRLEPTNLNRLPVPLRWRGDLKVHALKKQLRLLRPCIKVTCHPQHLTDLLVRPFMEALPSDTMVWDCTDDATIQQALYSYMHSARRTGLYRKSGYDKWTIGAYRNMSVWLPDDYRPGYTTTHANAVTSALAAAIGIVAQGRGVSHDVNIDIERLVNEGGTHGTNRLA